MISNQIREALAAVCSLLNKHDVDYIIVGGVAVSYHGYDRVSTLTIEKPQLKVDLDFWYRPTTDNFIRLTEAVGELGVDRQDLDKIIFDPKKTFLKIPHKSFHTDFLPQALGLDSYATSKTNAIKETIDGNKLHILAYKDLIANKMAVNRKSDAVDIKELKTKK